MILLLISIVVFVTAVAYGFVHYLNAKTSSELDHVRWQNELLHAHNQELKQELTQVQARERKLEKQLVDQMLQAQPPGKYAAFHKDMERKFTTRKLHDTDTQIISSPKRLDTQ